MADIDATKAKSTVFIGGLAQTVDENVLLEAFAPFGDIMEIQIPPAAGTNGDQPPADGKHRGFAFVTFGTQADAQDAIDNMDMNELKGKVLKVSLARPQRAPVQGAGNRAIWETEEWLQVHAKPLGDSGGVKAKSGGQDSGTPDKTTGDGEDAMEE
ncbi:RNA-binding domain-containing protein [Serendipita vermifera]|nr:RNA-binding domain-containing protein [Serendipita vermifera]